MADPKDTKAEQARQEKLAATSPMRDDQPDPRANTEVKRGRRGRKDRRASTIPPGRKRARAPA
jgi:hypothetical protein